VIAAPIGQPPVFYRPDSAYAPLFEAMRGMIPG
jgi:alpha-glucosidase